MTMRYARYLGFALILVLLASIQGAQSFFEVDSVIASSPGDVVMQAEGDAVTGWLNVYHGDPPLDSGEGPRLYYTLTTDQGDTVAVDLNISSVEAGLLMGERVTVRGDFVSLTPSDMQAQWADEALRADSITLANGEEPATTLAVSGSKAYLNILCRFGDITGTTPNQPSFYSDLMLGDSPSLDHFWRQTSYDMIDLTGSNTVGWFNLPKARSQYVTIVDGSEQADLDALADDCAAQADPTVDFTQYDGINFMFNERLDCCAWGGGNYLYAEGQWLYFPTTWMPPWGQNIATIGHEMGHSFGLPHSTGPASNPPTGMSIYVSKWDIMSRSIGTCAVRDQTNYCLPPATIGYHVTELTDWLPSYRRVEIPVGHERAFTIDPLNRDDNADAYGVMYVKVPVNGDANRFYTIEVRDVANGYDKNVPAKAVVIHDVDPTRYGNGGHAYVVDTDGNSDTNDGGSQWMPGETFSDLDSGITIEVIGEYGDGYDVRINNNALSAPNMPSNTQIASVASKSATIQWSDNSSNENGFNIYQWQWTGYEWRWLYDGAVGANQTTYTDTGLDCNATYYYRVTSYRSNSESLADDWVTVLTADCTSLDMTGDGYITPVDAVYVINRVGRTDGDALTADIDGDGQVTETDAQMVMDRLGESVAE